MIEVAAGGEKVAASIRLIMFGLLLAGPVFLALTMDKIPFELYVGIAGACLGVVIAVYILYLSYTKQHSSRRHFIISALDVSLITGLLFFFAYRGKPEVAINSMVIWELYLLFIIASSLYLDVRVCISTALIAVTQYAILLIWVTTGWDMNALDLDINRHVFSGISWYIQFCRFLLMFIAAFIAIGIVVRSRNLLTISGTDTLTGLENRRVFEARLKQEISRATRTRTIFSVAYLDLDNFKQFNDQWGHATGDKVLKLVAHTIREHTRREDVIARWGGEEILMLFPNTQKHEAKELIERIQSNLKDEELPVANKHEYISFSAGVAQFPDDGDQPGLLINHADVLLKTAKETGKDKVVSNV